MSEAHTEPLTLDELTQAAQEIEQQVSDWYQSHIKANPNDIGKHATYYEEPHTYGPKEFEMPSHIHQLLEQKGELIGRWIRADLARRRQGQSES